MKKTWIAPGIENEVLSATAFNASQGEQVDGFYLDHVTCEYVEVFAS